jgi:hypothetical protein
LIARLRKILLVILGATMLVGLVAAVLAWDEVRRLSPEEVRQRITEAVKSESGLDLVAARVTIQISYHVVIDFHAARLLDGKQQVARFARITLICGYRTLLFHRGLPFLSVIMEQPELVLPLHSVTPGPLPVMDAATVADLRRILVRLSNITRQVAMFRATVEDHEGRVLFDQAVVRATHGKVASAWQLNLKGYFRGVGLPNFRIGASLAMAPEMDGPEVPFARGSLWFWDAALAELATRGFSLKGQMRGNLTFLVRNDGVVKGQALTRIAAFQLGSARLTQPLALTDLAMSARLSHSPAALEVSQFSVRADNSEVLSGSADFVPLAPGDLRIRARISPLSFGAEQLKSLVFRMRELPAWLSGNVRLVSGGNLTIDQLMLDSTLKDLEAPSARILRQVVLKATLDGLAFTPVNLPPIAELVGKLEYVDGLARFTQGHASFGASTLSDIRLSADIARGLRDIPYQAAVAGDLEIGELFSAARKLMSVQAERRLKRVDNLRGKAAVDIALRGHLTDFALANPPEYKAVLRPQSVTVEVVPEHWEFRLFDGSVIVTPTEILIDRLDLAPLHGSIKASGRIKRPTPSSLEVARLELDLRHIYAEEWLPHLIAMDTMDVHAPATGKLEIVRGDDGARPYRVNGKLAVGPGQIKFAFLRSPVLLTDLAALSLDGQGGTLAVRSGKFEGSLLDMTVGVADAGNPLIRIDAVAQKLDLEAIRAVRLPWSAKTPTKNDDSRFEGRVQAQEANLARMDMKNLKANFKRDDNEWRVFDINADALGGHIRMDLGGHKRDDWVHIRTNAQDLDVVQLQVLADSQTLVTGRLSSNSDLWADTNNDFFSTMAGTLAFTVRDGVLLRFKLLSRMLSLVDLSAWLDAKVPDPRVNGVPFKTITANFIGQDGSFRTDDFLLDGSVMKITAAGHVNVGQSALKMSVGMRPFQLFDTVFNKIPLIGSRLAQSQAGIVAAYFNVDGPIADPRVLPAPIMSISHMLIKTLAIPINLLLPETIK